jgi:glycosyltransferase involved in cell wall biosynthesis
MAQAYKTTHPRTLMIVPAYNEAAKVAATIADLRANVPWADILVVDDGSADDTARQARQAGATVAMLPFNLGVGGAMQTGYLYAFQNNYDIAVQFDGDGQHCADQIPALIAGVESAQADLVIGSRLLGPRTYKFSLMRWVGSRLLVGMVRLLTGLKVTDPTSGFRSASRPMIRFFSQHYPQAYLGDTVEALAMAAWHGMTIREVPAQMRMTRTSSISNLIGMIHMMRICLALMVDRIERRYPMPPLPPRNQPARQDEKTIAD